MIGSVLPLIQTLFDIIRFRKGPDAIPYSPVLFVMAASLWFVSGLPAYVLIDFVKIENFWIDTVIGATAMVVYGVVITAFGKQRRMMQSLTALLGCATVLSLLFVSAYVLLNPFLGKNFALVLAYLIILWSIVVDGHIISRSVDQNMYLGLLIAIGVFMMQIQIDIALKPPLAEP